MPISNYYHRFIEVECDSVMISVREKAVCCGLIRILFFLTPCLHGMYCGDAVSALSEVMHRIAVANL